MPLQDYPGPMTRGPKWLQNTINQIIDAGKSNRPRAGKNVTLNQSGDGVAVSSEGGSGGDDNLETVTGAVNGVPSTLKVQTDGNGWVAV